MEIERCDTNACVGFEVLDENRIRIWDTKQIEANERGPILEFARKEADSFVWRYIRSLYGSVGRFIRETKKTADQVDEARAEEPKPAPEAKEPFFGIALPRPEDNLFRNTEGTK